MDRQLHKLRRDELLEILLEVEQENEQLTQRNLELREQLGRRELSIRQAGSLAEASVELSGLLAATQDAVDLFVRNVRDLCLRKARQTEELCARAREGQGAEGDGEARVSLEDEVNRMFAEAFARPADEAGDA